jgi:16S rRNA (guanine966-N2)-methyltransferase
MRIVAGEWRGRRISAPAGKNVRPTLDRVREAWMSIMQTDLPDARVLDLFSGSGALGLEALSRGAASAEFVENHGATFRMLQENIETLGAGSRAIVHRKDALQFVKDLEADTFDVAFADPPYESGADLKLAQHWLDKPFSRVLAIEHSSRTQLPEGNDRREYGTTAITFYRK